MIRPVVGGGGTTRGQTGVSQRVHVGFLRSRPPDTPHRTAGTASPGSAGVPPASCSFGRRRASVRCCRQPPCRREQQRPGRRRAMAPFPVDPSGGDDRGCARLWCGRDDRAPRKPSSHDLVTPKGTKVQKHFGAACRSRRSICLLVYLCLFVSIGGSSSLTISCFSSK